ncbi:MAG: GAF domain-containing protein [Myxacorys chilensis ATA2-1-KO14]|nr:GAF domain-containing protein [Myxacorys chilensis ATA2-1-KO14]
MTKPERIREGDLPYLSASTRNTSSLKVDPVLTALLQAVCETTVWEYGEAWTPTPDRELLEISSAWYTRTNLSSDRRIDWEHFHNCSQKFVLHPGEGLPGRVWVTQEAEWLVDAAAELKSYFLRNQIAKAFGARATFGLPVSIGASQAILVFFMSEVRKEDPHLIEATQTAVAHLSELLPL